MLGFWKGRAVDVLGGGDSDMWTENTFVGTEKNDNQTKGMLDGIQPIVIAPGDEAPAPSKQAPWGHPNDPASQKILNPYTGYQYVTLQSDRACGIEVSASCMSETQGNISLSLCSAMEIATPNRVSASRMSKR